MSCEEQTEKPSPSEAAGSAQGSKGGAGSKSCPAWGPLNGAGEFPCSKSKKPQGAIYSVCSTVRHYTAMPLIRFAGQRHGKT